ncbi:unnamed protein product [Colias eurytheme]|nr:unnamed protein product [Colias eurytheme]
MEKSQATEILLALERERGGKSDAVRLRATARGAKMRFRCTRRKMECAPVASAEPGKERVDEKREEFRRSSATRPERDNLRHTANYFTKTPIVKPSDHATCGISNELAVS